MDPRTAARLFGASRVAFGAALIAAPAVLGRPWIGPAADTAGGQVALRALGIRDMALGAMSLHVVDDPGAGPGMALTCAVSDAVDLAATLVAKPQLPRSAYGVAALAANGAATGLWLWSALRR
jgi:hypothetical protein